jgi:hypothetical protein
MKLNQIKLLFNKYRNMREEHFEQIPLLMKFIINADFFLSFFLYGSSITDYFQYEFYKKKHIERKTFITFRKYRWIQKICNKSETCSIFLDKSKFNIMFKEFIGREWINLGSCSYVDFETFSQRHQVCIVKPVDGVCGRGIHKLKFTNNTILKEEFSKLKTKNVILEEKIVQIDALAEFNPESVNTIRITTIYAASIDKVVIMNAVFRIGNGLSVVDNFASGGIIANIDIETGIINTVGTDKKRNRFILHPVTKKQIVGFVIPRWGDIIDTVVRAARIVPTVQYAGWDVTIKDNEEIIFLEANNNADHNVQQFSEQRGRWPIYKKIINRGCTLY